jgi:AraC family transcriptional regulator, ethanolamine operon transcriptional activator
MSALSPSGEKRSATIRSMRFDDMDTMARTMIGDHVAFIPLRSGPFHGRFCEVQLGGFTLRRIFHSPTLVIGAATQDCVSLQATMRPVEGVTVNGDAFGASSLAVITSGADLQATYPAEQDRISLFFRQEAFDTLVDSCGARAFPQRTHRMLHPYEEQPGTLVRAFACILDLAESLPNLFEVPGLGNAVSEECQRLLTEVLSSADGRPERPRQTSDMLRQVRVADEFLQAHINRPVYTDELCTAVHVSARSLHQSFAAVYGMSPHAFLKRRRLILIHRALRSAREPNLVKSIALAHGFWHLGRFAHEYAAMFGKMPSETLDKGHKNAAISAAA